MTSRPICLLAISGSLRRASTNRALLGAVALLAPADMTITIYDGVAALPHFNPDLDVDPLPAMVIDLRAQVGAADGLLFSAPEYARGVPGSLKNALDWLVSSDVFPGKPVAFFHASERGVVSQAALRLILETMSAPDPGPSLNHDFATGYADRSARDRRRHCDGGENTCSARSSRIGAAGPMTEP
jgi:chromate reductase